MGKSRTKHNHLLREVLGFVIFSYIYPVIVCYEWYHIILSLACTRYNVFDRYKILLHIVFAIAGAYAYAVIFITADAATVPIDLEKYSATFVVETKPTWWFIALAYYKIAAALVSNLANTAYKVSSIYVLMSTGSPILVTVGSAWFLVSLFAWTEA